MSSTIGVAGEVDPVLDFGVVKLVGEFDSASGDIDELLGRDGDVLLAVVVVCAHDDVRQYVCDGGDVVGDGFNSDLGGDFVECFINFGSPSQSVGRQEIGLGFVEFLI